MGYVSVLNAPLQRVDVVLEVIVVLTELARRGSHGFERIALLHGQLTDEVCLIEHAAPVRNTHRRPGGFGVSRADFDAAWACGDLVGVFHTHRQDCVPSPSDRDAFRSVPLLHLIGAVEVGDAFPLKIACFCSADRREIVELPVMVKEHETCNPC